MGGETRLPTMIAVVDHVFVHSVVLFGVMLLLLLLMDASHLRA